MKTLNKFFLLPLAALMFSCNNEVIDDLQGTYDGINRFNSAEAQTQETTKLKKGLKCLHIILTDCDSRKFDLKVVSPEWTLQPGSYTPVSDAAALATAGRYQASIDGTPISNGVLDVNIVKGMYLISGILDGSNGSRHIVNYRGKLDFEIGVDDPEASGYTISLKVDPVAITDFTTWQTTIIPGVSKYTVAITDPDGNDAAFFEAVNKENLQFGDLAGSYTIQGSPAEPWLIDNGWLVPEYGMAGGAFVVNNGEKQYITAGQINFEAVKCSTGETLYNFSGDGLDFTSISGNSGKTGFNIKFATLNL